MLNGIRVVDLAGPSGQYCGKLLADLGARVIKIEPIEGDGGRRMKPFQGDQIDANQSLFWAYYNTNKRSLALDLASQQGQGVFERLVRWADAIVQTGSDLRYDELSRLNPRLILASISSFGEGPCSGYRATSQSVFAMSGIMKTIGPPQGPPVAAPGQIPLDLAAIDAASGILCALLMRHRTGVGQHVSVAALDVLAAQVNPRPREQFVATRHARVYNPTLAPGGTYACADGGVELTIVLPGHWHGLQELLGNPAEIAGPEWNERGYREAHADQLGGIVAAAFASRSQHELVREAQRLHVPCGPINTVATFAADPQIEARGFFEDLSTPGLGPHKIAGAPYKMSAGAWTLQPAPRLGEHTAGILAGELGYSPTEIAALRSANVVLCAEDV
ncbi:MAG TPA: CoA transferase [Chloroflexota bacterium]|nr:CoA transferase [Chloroflexota bacterium]